MAGAELDVGAFVGSVDPSKRWLDTEIYGALLKPIVVMTNTAICTPSDHATQVGKLIWARVRDFKNTHAPHSEAFNRTSMQGFAAAYGDWRSQHPRRKIPTISFLAPLEAADVGWELVQRSTRNVKSMEYLFWGLGILGWVATIYSDMRICRYCFRWSVPGSPFCFLHTQSTFVSDGKKAYVRYRAGARVLALSKKRAVQIRRDDPVIDSSYWRTILAEYLFFQSPQIEYENEMRELLLSSPRVMNLIGGRRTLHLPDGHLLKRVRERLNPMEWMPQALLFDVLLAENVLLLDEERRKPGRPRGERSEGLLRMTERAKLMLESGARLTDVAIALKQSTTTISNWTRRFEDVRHSYQIGREKRNS